MNQRTKQRAKFGPVLFLFSRQTLHFCFWTVFGIFFLVLISMLVLLGFIIIVMFYVFRN